MSVYVSNVDARKNNKGGAVTSAQGLSVPVGAVLPYAGQLNNNQLNAMGWSICDGSQYSITDYPELFAALGTCNGGNGNSNFNIPDYQGYFLRGVDMSGTVDKGASARTSPRSGAASGAQVGSVEGYATAVPNTPFQAYVPHVPTSAHEAYRGSNADMLLPTRFAQNFYSDGGGDAETRPTNAYVNYIIKLVPQAALPTGAVVTFAGSGDAGSVNLLSWYLTCDGNAMPQELYTALFNAIGTAHGGDKATFHLPDYRGRFLRGVDNGSMRDPDAASRTAMAAGGAVGDAVGSVQDYATARPTTPFSISITLAGSDRESDHCAGHDNSAWNPGSSSVSFTASGGDAESRPVNVNVDYYILRQDDPNNEDIFPIGAVIGFPGNTPPPSGQWLLCNGSSLPNSGQFADLFCAIQYANGGDGTANFNLPNYQGYFLRGTDHGQNRDPDNATRTAAQTGGQTGDNVGSLQGWATGRPKTTDITGQVTHMPTDDAHNAAATGTDSVAEWQGPQTPTVGGGDPETRPLNANILFYIKYAATSPA